MGVDRPAALLRHRLENGLALESRLALENGLGECGTAAHVLKVCQLEQNMFEMIMRLL